MQHLFCGEKNIIRVVRETHLTWIYYSVHGNLNAKVISMCTTSSRTPFYPQQACGFYADFKIFA
jgi:hypothetical protein